MWLFYVLLTIYINIEASSVDYLQHPLKSCHVGDIVENECSRCVCSSKTIFECTALDCNYTKNILNETQVCHPNQLYVQNLISCICNKDGQWPHKSCYDVFKSLPPDTVVKQRCVPNSYVVADCNVCRCGPFGEILSNQCTKNVCEDTETRRANKASSIYGNCEINTWYSSAAYQFCFCVNGNRLVCNTGNHYSKNLDLGNYNFVVCGKDLMEDAMDLLPDSQRVLRFSLHKKKRSNIAASTPIQKPTEHNVSDDVDKNNKLLETNDNENNEEEINSDTQEEKSVHNAPAVVSTIGVRHIVSTQNPYQEGDEANNENESDDNKNEDVEEQSSDERIYMPTVPTAKRLETEKSAKNVAKPIKPDSLAAFGETLKINLPKVLNKVFQMALRKSMVSLNSKTNCTPGETSMKECNMCFCLKNGKLLCTDNPCK